MAEGPWQRGLHPPLGGLRVAPGSPGQRSGRSYRSRGIWNESRFRYPYRLDELRPKSEGRRESRDGVWQTKTGPWRPPEGWWTMFSARFQRGQIYIIIDNTKHPPLGPLEGHDVLRNTLTVRSAVRSCHTLSCLAAWSEPSVLPILSVSSAGRGLAGR